MHYHFIAIGGIGMSALAHILIERGCKVSGSDSQESFITHTLQAKGAHVAIGYSPHNLPEEGIVVYSTHVVNGNRELEAAKKRGLPLIHRSRLLAELTRGKKALLVAGTHGKTTTSSLLAHVLHECGLKPSYAVGGVIHSLQGNGGDGEGPYFVAEACESDGTFLDYPGYGAIVTNIDNDHLDYWKNEQALADGFHTFMKKIASKEHLLFCIDDERMKTLHLRGISYGFSHAAQARILTYTQTGWQLSMDVQWRDHIYSSIGISLIGKHNVLNGTAVFILGLCLGIPEKAIRAALQSFRGIERRVEKKGEEGGIAVFDDYGHHPTEIATTLAAMKKAVGSRRLVAVFQPHRYTRTRDCMEGFSLVFENADLICLTDIYSAGESPIPGVDLETLLVMLRAKRGEKVLYLPRNGIAHHLKGHLLEGDVVLTIGAGDITKVGPEILKQLSIG